MQVVTSTYALRVATRFATISGVDPLVVYVVMAALLFVASVLVGIFRHAVTRKCPLCDAKVEMGRQHCQVCHYRFSAARFY